MKVSIITCFESNEERVKYLKEACEARGYDINVYTSDFSHIRKEKRNSIPDGYCAVKTRAYRKNLSLARILSHKHFAKDVFRLVKKERPDLIWLIAPANYLIKEAKKYKKSSPNTKLIIDIIDMWPESLPVNINKDMLPFRIWRSIRRNNIDCCDALVTECNLYHDILKKEYNRKITTIHWAREAKTVANGFNFPESALSLCYIGSINNIIDSEKIASIIEKIDMPVILHVVGEGENTEHFLETVKKKCEVIYHGPIRDEEKKTDIFNRCHAGINIYKEGLYIGLTVKCIDYFQHGLPIINNIKGDTWDMVDKYQAGINVKGDAVINAKKLIMMRYDGQSIYDLFNENFTKEVFQEKCLKVIDEVME